MPLISLLLALILTSQAFGGNRLQLILENPKEWGDAGQTDVLKVLHEAADPLWREFPHRDLSPIRVSAKGGPILLYKRTLRDEYIIRLDTGDLYWSQYIYQFSHEFGHVLCRGKTGKHPNSWFEEAICECASLYVLRKLGEEWKTKPPYPNWKGYSQKLTKYADQRIEKTEKVTDLAAWYAVNKSRLQAKADDRPLNQIVALRLLTELERAPEHWQAMAYLNRSPTRGVNNLETHLNDWYQAAPREHGKLIRTIAEWFEIEIKSK